MSAPMKSTTSAWIISVRFAGELGAGRPRVEAARRRAVEERGEHERRRGRRRPRVLRPSSATAMPMKPMCDAWMSSTPRRNCQPSMSIAPARPAKSSGDRHREEVVARHGDAAVARRLGVEADGAHLVAERRPVEDDPVDDERRERDEEPDVEALEERVAPEDRQLRPSTTSFEIGPNAARCSGAARRGRRGRCPPSSAIQLSMIVVITSCAPTVALRIPAMPPRPRPPAPRRRSRGRRGAKPFMPANDEPTQIATIAPTKYWPWPPMLKSPQRNANATASPVRIAASSEDERLLEVVRREGVRVVQFHRNQTWGRERDADLVVPNWKNQLRPVPSKIAL